MRLRLGRSARFVLRAVLDDKQYKEIAAACGLCLKSVQYHVRCLKSRLGAESRAGIMKQVLLGC